MNQTELQQRRIDAAINYFRYVDNADPSLISLFTEDAMVTFPKLGVAHGKAEIGLLAQGFGSEIIRIEHDIENFNVMPSGNHVIIEGQVSGETYSGGAFPDNVYSHGRFCNVFEFVGDLIKRINIYEDPDFNSADAPRIEWAKKVHDSLAQHRASL
ncbi:nuclear transport factor 2 family protein [Paenibacillus glycanilyticus]|uniref:nuclear transport factor 2 family protein n=1 Tax=Paenibacillus glycanilyticus TaxID=126569 RepID=UPI00203BC8FA|nr:nuclear transport factor 2 family protein [Paenibacillus glycanilyticus]MCM3629091.1 nuclear transport factor 2 family protein [Paenibacillus glycanilyticus]